MEPDLASLAGHTLIGIDTPVFIYLLEGSIAFADVAQTVLEAVEMGTPKGVTSVLTLMELSVGPLQQGRRDVAQSYARMLLRFPNLTVVPIGASVAERAAELRARYRLRPADALQVAACLIRGATAFVTNDRDLPRVSEVTVILLGGLLPPSG